VPKVPAKKVVSKQDPSSLKYSKISDSQDPFISLYKEIMQPLFDHDRLSCLRKDFTDFQIILKPKDLKCLRPDRKEEIMS
jgi:hypothetical protein